MLLQIDLSTSKAKYGVASQSGANAQTIMQDSLNPDSRELSNKRVNDMNIMLITESSYFIARSIIQILGILSTCCATYVSKQTPKKIKLNSGP